MPVFLDEAFVELFPNLASDYGRGFEILPAAQLSEIGTEKTASALRGWTPGGVAVVSPLLAGTLGTSADAPNLGTIILPLQGASPRTSPGAAAAYVAPVSFDFSSAYRRMGRLAGERVRAAAKSDTEAHCAIVFKDNFMRGQEALAAFREGFEAEAGADRLKVIQVPQSTDPVGSARTALESAKRNGLAALALAVDEASEALAAIAASDSGSEGSPVFIGADVTAWSESDVKNLRADYRIAARWTALKHAVKDAALAARKKPAKAPEERLVPLSARRLILRRF